MPENREHKLVIQGIFEDIIAGRERQSARTIAILSIILFVAAYFEQRVLYALYSILSLLVLLGSYIWFVDTFCLYKLKRLPGFAYLIQTICLAMMSVLYATQVSVKYLLVMLFTGLFLFLLNSWGTSGNQNT